MKRHGNYHTASVDDIRAALELEAHEYINVEVRRIKQKYRNDKRHKDRRKKIFNYKKK